MGNSLTPQIENAEKTGVCSLNGKGLKEVGMNDEIINSPYVGSDLLMVGGA